MSGFLYPEFIDQHTIDNTQIYSDRIFVTILGQDKFAWLVAFNYVIIDDLKVRVRRTDLQIDYFLLTANSHLQSI